MAIDLPIATLSPPGVDGREVAQIGRSPHLRLKLPMIAGQPDHSLLRKPPLGPSTEWMRKPFSLDVTGCAGGESGPHAGGRP